MIPVGGLVGVVGEIAAGGEVEIGESILVVIDAGDAGAIGGGEGFFTAIAGVMDEFDARVSDGFEPDGAAFGAFGLSGLVGFGLNEGLLFRGLFGVIF